MSSPQDLETDTSVADPCDTVSRMLSRVCVRSSTVWGGRNSRIDRVQLSDGSTVILKRHLTTPTVGRNRAEAEHAALSFMTGIGMTSTPRLLAADVAAGCLVMQDIPGVNADTTPMVDTDIEQYVGFLLQLNQSRAHANGFGDASEAAFSVVTAIEIVRRRRSLLDNHKAPPELSQSVDGFLAQDFDPTLARIDEVLSRSLRDELAATLPPEDRILSPSDLGPHNAIRRPDGQLALVDFEHFGWDDPAKTACDFLLHPGFETDPNLRSAFALRLASALPGSAEIEARITALYPVFALKWCVILLNEFLPGHLNRRRFASADSGAVGLPAHLQGQLELARSMVKKAQLGIDRIATP